MNITIKGVMTHVIFHIDLHSIMDTISDPKANFSELGFIVSECRSLQLANCNAYKLHNSLLA